MENTKTLILPDIHTHYKKAEKIISVESPDNIVFLGDYFDDWNDTVEQNYLTAKWLKESLNKPNRIHCFGNHELNYAFRQKSYRCSGYTDQKYAAINSVLKEEDWRKLVSHTWVGEYLCTHAGVHRHFYEKYGNGEDFRTWLIKICDEAFDNAFKNKPSLPILRAGQSRSGIEMYGGIVWCDKNEFVNIDSVKQIFGHTPVEKPTWLYDNNLALDVNNSDYYAIHLNNRITTHWIGEN
jgi:Calcineurin-like phosphoesterase